MPSPEPQTMASRPSRRLWAIVAIVGAVFLQGCMSVPKGVEPIRDFVLEDYLGTWYEVARLDHRFERGLSHVSATYTLRPDGLVQVFNRGWREDDQEWTSITGSAKWADDSRRGHLGVSFFGPFRFSYVVFDWDRDAGTAFVSGPDHDTLWLLARTPDVSEETRQRFITVAQDSGFDLEELIWVEHRDPPSPRPPMPPPP